MPARGGTCILASRDRSFVGAAGTRFLLIEGGRAPEVPDAAGTAGR